MPSQNTHKISKPRIIAFYLPQFHPIPENDEWWGKGFTEWTNTAKAKPLFRGHYQPHVPADLGFYDLRLPEVREQQAEMARESGIEGFCYWHYWFGNGRQILDRVFREVLADGKPDYPFCLGWANESWSGIWHGNPSAVMLEQTYPGKEDYEAHFNSYLPAFKDKRYVKVDGKPLVYIYRPLDIPDTELFFETWQTLAKANGLPGIYFIGFSASRKQAGKVLSLGYDAANAYWLSDALLKKHFVRHTWNKLMEIMFRGKFKLSVFRYPGVAGLLSDGSAANENICPSILSGWDNSPRSGRRGLILTRYTPEAFRRHVSSVLGITKGKNPQKNIIFLKSWNEWAEGNHMEPDLKYGHKFLNALKDELER